ncbi:BRCA1 C Terminus (BRCT) protein [Gemmobacter caeni]|uniref:BRCA1 C Terminus (BRCT) protein n=1 Tax=Gemmobacter caeni TaxID=589035 RepID=A0A2T6A039_9RHOB|nr:hypothetical protein [Gemmobacter caeni]PTX37185.1 BRCA1 C Terminus (BRCT) protein [Gemmobacter caeni]TWI87738.1 BRCA1 C Terminus (BRCT) protein [Gemmobacter caeni]
MSFLSWIFGRASTKQSPPPELAKEVIGQEIEDSTETVTQTEDLTPSDGPSRDHEALENLFCQIEYVDAAGSFSRRPVTFMSADYNGDTVLITALCHMRKAMRTFRADRIKCVITADGEVFDGADFVTNTLGISIPKKRHSAAEDIEKQSFIIPPRQPREFRDCILAPLSVLVACGHADGSFHIEELDRIMAWAEMEAVHLHRNGEIAALPTIEEMDALGRTIANMRPQLEALKNHMVTTLTMNPGAVERFEKALDRVISADGIIHDEEASFVDEFAELARMVRKDPQVAIKFINAVEAKTLRTPSGDLNGAIFVFSGALSTMKRKEAQDTVRACNGVVKTNVDFSHEFYDAYLVLGAGSGAKREKAIASGLPILTEAEFLEMVGLMD